MNPPPPKVYENLLKVAPGAAAAGMFTKYMMGALANAIVYPPSKIFIQFDGARVSLSLLCKERLSSLQFSVFQLLYILSQYLNHVKHTWICY